MKPIFFSIALLLSWATMSCRFGNDTSKDSGGIKMDFKKGTLDPKDWNCIDKENVTVCLPKGWDLVKQKSVFHFAALGKNQDYKYQFLSMIKLNIDSSEYDAKSYLREAYRQLVADTSEIFTGYTLKRIVFKNKESYYGEYYSKVGTREYLGYAMTIEQYGYLYDICLKVDKTLAPNYKQTFTNILYNWKIDGENVFTEHDEYIRIEDVNLEGL